MGLIAAVTAVVVAGIAKTKAEYDVASDQKKALEAQSKAERRNAEIVRAAGVRAAQRKRRETRSQEADANRQQEAEAGRMRAQMGASGLTRGTQFELLSDMATRHQFNLDKIDYMGKSAENDILNNYNMNAYQRDLNAWKLGASAVAVGNARNSALEANLLQTGASALSMYAAGGGFDNPAQPQGYGFSSSGTNGRALQTGNFH